MCVWCDPAFVAAIASVPLVGAWLARYASLAWRRTVRWLQLMYRVFFEPIR